MPGWKALPWWLKAWFALGTLKLQPSRTLIARLEVWLHASGFACCVGGVASEPALVGGVLLLAHAYLCTLLKWQGDRYAVWPGEVAAAGG